MDIKTVPASPVLDRGVRQDGASKVADYSREVRPDPLEERAAAEAREQQAGAQDKRPVEEAVSTLSEFAHSIQRDLDFSLDDGSGSLVVRVTDRASGDVIRQIPSEEALRLADSLDVMRSLLFEAKA